MLRHEYVALGAHLDHLGRESQRATHAGGQTGKDDIYNGADDDGSGVVALLQMAEAVAAGPRPKRSLLFVWHTGEEYGSWGAKYFTAFPTVPLDHIVAQLNVDMIGRSRQKGDDTPEDQVLSGPNEVYIVGSRRLSQDLGDTCDRVDRAFLNLALNYKYDAPDDPERIYERSDHYEYAQKGIPVAFFFTGLHGDYHRVTDEVERIDFEKLQKVAQTVLATAWTLANAPDRPRVNGTK
jgi:Zn-dependent M28 family amino/carboxypeptidase